MTNSMVAANTIRRLSAAMPERAKSGHPGGAMGAADFITILYSEFLRFDPDDTSWFNRDRFFYDPGHMSPLLYATLAQFGYFSKDDLQNFRQWGSVTPGHPEVDVARGIENTSGPLGQGHVNGIGAAIAEAFLHARHAEHVDHKTFAMISDGGVQEEISQGGARVAGTLGLGNLIMFYDSNDIQLSTEVTAATNEDTAKKYESWHWHVQTIDGNDHDAIRKALKAAIEQTSKPSLIIGKTVMGKGAVTESGEPFEHQVSMHGMPITGAGGSFEKTIKNLDGDAKDPFATSAENDAFWAEIKEQKRTEVQARKTQLPTELQSWVDGELPDINWSQIANDQKENVATRASSSYVLSQFADLVPNMIVASADLANSDKTDGFLKKTKPFVNGDFSGAFLHVGVSEFSMAAMANGMALHGGVIPVCATFFAFSDYMKPALRMASLMQLPVKFMWTHDAFRVGEDGPTHQPIEHEAQLRLLEKVHNHDHKPGMLVLRPADAAETTVAWKMALENNQTPTGLIFTRQNIHDISNYEQAKQAEKGAFVVHEADNAELTIIANGSEVATAVEAAKLLNDHKIRVVSVPSEGRFREQTLEYQESIIPKATPKAGITAGLAVNLLGLVGDESRIHSLEHFGFSAPAGKLDEEFGFTAEKLAAKVQGWLA